MQRRFPFHLASLGLFDRADLKSGENVLIHAAAGGSGSAAIQLAVGAWRARLRDGRLGREARALP
jgi:NADPH-dependent curcumin reductase CurA